jgi:hypothetical protein
MASAPAIQASCHASRTAKTLVKSICCKNIVAKSGSGQELDGAPQICDSLNSCAAHKN